MGAEGALVRSARQAAGLSQAELARRAGTTQAHVSRVERGLVSPTVRSLQTILAAAGSTVEFSATPTAGWSDPDELRRFRALSMAERLDQAFTASAFASELLGAAKR